MTRLSASVENVYIAQGEHAIGNRSYHMITTILGSCVAVCLWDRRRGVGGMNHILLPDDAGSEILARSMGAGAMETLINALMKAGCAKSDLDAKVFGGAAVVEGLSDIGRRNGDFALGFLETERIPVVSRSLGGGRARRIRFWPASGRVAQKLVSASSVPNQVPPRPPRTNDLELL